MTKPKPKQEKAILPEGMRVHPRSRPKTFNAARVLAVQIANEVARITNKDGKQEALVFEGHVVTVAEHILRKWSMSGDSKLQIMFMEYAFGPPPTTSVLTGKSTAPVQLEVVYAPDKAVPAALPAAPLPLLEAEELEPPLQLVHVPQPAVPVRRKPGRPTRQEAEAQLSRELAEVLAASGLLPERED